MRCFLISTVLFISIIYCHNAMPARATAAATAYVIPSVTIDDGSDNDSHEKKNENKEVEIETQSDFQKIKIEDEKNIHIDLVF